VTCRNPHMRMTAIDPPGEGRRWKCVPCGAIGPYDELRAIECTAVYPPCPYCKQTPECARDCAGMLAILGSPDVHVVGMRKPKLPSA
jgi:hypothetical protein